MDGIIDSMDMSNEDEKYWSFSISHFNEYSGLISFRIDWFDDWLLSSEQRDPTFSYNVLPSPP